jgi:hypothetical protein
MTAGAPWPRLGQMRTFTEHQRKKKFVKRSEEITALTV